MKFETKEGLLPHITTSKGELAAGLDTSDSGGPGAGVRQH